MAAEQSSEAIPVQKSTVDLPNTNKDSTKSGLTHSLTIKLDEKNFLLWSQQVNGVITAHNLHRFIVNPEIPLQFASVADRLEGKNSDEYQKWLFKDQTLFTWLLSTIFDGVLPRVLSRKHSHEVWEKIHTYFNIVLKSRARQLRSELKNTKKLSRMENEYLLRIKSIVNSLIAIGDIVSEREQVDAILEGSLQEKRFSAATNLVEKNTKLVRNVFFAAKKILLHVVGIGAVAKSFSWTINVAAITSVFATTKIVVL